MLAFVSCDNCEPLTVHFNLILHLLVVGLNSVDLWGTLGIFEHVLCAAARIVFFTFFMPCVITLLQISMCC